MFLKPFRIKSTTLGTESDKKKLKLDIASAYPVLRLKEVDDLIPDKVPLLVVQILTCGGVGIKVYHVNQDPLFFQHGKRIAPTVYTVGKCPHMLRQIRIHLPSITRLKNGADLLLHGMNTNVNDGGLPLEGIKANEYCSVLGWREKDSSGVVMSMMSSEMMKAGMTGRGFKVLQVQGDLLWEMGSTWSSIDLNSPSICRVVRKIDYSSSQSRLSESYVYPNEVKAGCLTDVQHQQDPEGQGSTEFVNLDGKPADDKLQDAAAMHRLLDELDVGADEKEVSVSDPEECKQGSGDGDKKALEKSSKCPPRKMPGDMKVGTEKNQTAIQSNFFREHEAKLRRIEQHLRRAGVKMPTDVEDLSKVTDLSSLFLGIQSQPQSSEKTEEVDGVIDDEIEISIPEKYMVLKRSFGSGAEGVSKAVDEEASTSIPEVEATGRSVELEVGVAKSWYSILHHPVDATPTSDGEEDTGASHILEMDELLKECFLESLMMVKKSATPLPLLTSTLYRSYMVETCPVSMRLDVKKTSYKKLSRFLLTMQSQGLVNLKENEKGSEVITEIHYKHPEVKNFVPHLVPASSNEVLPGVVKSIKISSLYSPSHRLISLFRLFGYSKSSVLEFKQVREAVLKYIKDNQLADEKNPTCVIPDPLLCDALGEKGTSGVKGMLRQDIIKMIVEEMKPAYSITYGKGSSVIRRGKLEPIRLTLAQRMGNKKVTLVDNLDVYGIPASDVAHSLQRIAAASATVTDVPGHSSAHQVLVQGNAIKMVAKLLEENYGLPIKHIEAISKLKPPKPTKKKKKRK